MPLHQNGASRRFETPNMIPLPRVLELTPVRTQSKTGYFGVYLNRPGKPKP